MAHSRLPAGVLDVSAISLSGLCLAHCLALPVAATFMPLLAAWSDVEWAHLAFIAAAIPLSIGALLSTGGWRSPLVTGLAIVGVCLLAAGALLASDEIAEVTMTSFGGLSLATAHVLNWRRRAHRH